MTAAETTLDPRDPDPSGRPSPARRSRPRLVVAVAIIVLGAVTFVGASQPPGDGSALGPSARSGAVKLRALGSAPSSWDPARQSDVASAAVTAQVSDGLTAIDQAGQVQPALARSWSIDEGGRRIVFELRPNLRFSDGTPLTAEDVVASWLRVIDPQRPSPLASLLDEVEGAREYSRGEADAEEVGLRDVGGRVEVRLRRPASYFPAVAASPSLAVIPGRVGGELAVPVLPEDFPASGSYVPVAQTPEAIRLEANSHHWAGPPPLDVVELVTDIGGRSPVDAFEDGDLDLTPIGSFDAPWIRFDPTLGPQLRQAVSFSVTYYGFDTTEPPFDDPRVRRAFAQAVDWDRLIRIGNSDQRPADSLAPQGLAGRSDESFSQPFDPDGARRELAAAGFPEGRGFPDVALVTGGTATDEAAVAEWSEVLGVDVSREILPFGALFERLEDDPPPIWSLSWIADYPHAHDFLGLLALSDSGNNYARWSDAAYDAAIEEAAAAEDPDAQAEGYDRAQAILREEAPYIPLSYGQDWSLTAEGLLGANPTGLGFLRFGGLDWDR